MIIDKTTHPNAKVYKDGKRLRFVIAVYINDVTGKTYATQYFNDGDKIIIVNSYPDKDGYQRSDMPDEVTVLHTVIEDVEVKDDI